MVALFALSAFAVGYLRVRGIIRPLKNLMRGTEAIGERDLSYRIEPMAKDEFGDLAHQFNVMMQRLQETTVSKERLQESETRLKTTVDELRREIAEHKHTETERVKLQAALHRSEVISAMGGLVAGVAHEVRNPLFGISSILDAMEARFAGREEYQGHMRMLRGEVERLSKLMADLLEYGKPQPLEPQRAVLGEVIAQAIEACLPLAAEAGNRVETRVPADAIAVCIDRPRLAQVFQNLVENAIQHSPPGTAVWIEANEVRQDGVRFVECVVNDSGPGFREEDLKRIFDPFFTRRRGGTGLGLSIAQRIAEEHGGTIVACNRPEGGGAMTVRLPLAQLE